MFNVVSKLKLNLNKRNELNEYLQAHLKFIRDLSKEGIDKDCLINEYKNSLPLVVLLKTMDVLSKNQNYFTSNKSQLVIDKSNWDVFKVGTHYSVLIPFITRQPRVPLIMEDLQSIKLLDSRITQSEMITLGDLCIYSEGLDLYVNMSFHNANN